MAKSDEGLEVNIGDSIQIATRVIIIRGIVAMVYWRKDSGWEIEVEQANVAGGYSRWKQRHDGGEIIKINNKYIKSV